MSPAEIGIGIGVVALLLAAGIGFVVVLDGVAAGVLGGRRPLRRVLAGSVLDPVLGAAQLLLQQRTRTERPDAQAWALAPAALAGLAAVAAGTVPLADGMGLADTSAGIVLFGAAMALVMVCVFLHGWSPNSVPPMVGGYRFIAQALSYEMPLALVLIAAALPAQSLAMGDIVRSQAGLWNVVRQPLGLPLYLVAALGVAFWGPLAIPDAADLAGGTSAEDSGAGLLAWRLARATVLVALAAVGAVVFLGGWLGPWLPGPLWTIVKTAALLVVLVASGHLAARLRLERFVVVAWAVLIPLALVDVFASGMAAL